MNKSLHKTTGRDNQRYSHCDLKDFNYEISWSTWIQKFVSLCKAKFLEQCVSPRVYQAKDESSCPSGSTETLLIFNTQFIVGERTLCCTI